MIDIVAIIAFICFVVKSTKRGWVRAIYHAANVFVAAFCAFGVYPVVGLILTKTPLRTLFSKIGYENFAKNVDRSVTVEEYVKNFNSIFTRGATTLDSTEEALKVIADNMGTMACKTVAYLIVFVVLIYVVNYFLDKIKFFNRIRKKDQSLMALQGLSLGE